MTNTLQSEKKQETPHKRVRRIKIEIHQTDVRRRLALFFDLRAAAYAMWGMREAYRKPVGGGGLHAWTVKKRNRIEHGFGYLPCDDRAPQGNEPRNAHEFFLKCEAELKRLQKKQREEDAFYRWLKNFAGEEYFAKAIGAACNGNVDPHYDAAYSDIFRKRDRAGVEAFLRAHGLVASAAAESGVAA